MAERTPLQFRPVTELPTVSKQGNRTTPFSAIAEEASTNPGTWYELDCDSERQAANRAATMRKTHGMEAHSRAGKVYFRKPAPDGQTA